MASLAGCWPQGSCLWPICPCVKTLYSTLKQLATPAVNVCTIEDPIEMVEASFNQMQVQPVIDLGFAEGVRALMRQDPDIIKVTEELPGSALQKHPDMPTFSAPRWRNYQSCAPPIIRGMRTVRCQVPSVPSIRLSTVTSRTITPAGSMKSRALNRHYSSSST